MAKSLTNKLVLITGGARGIGRATAELFLTHGARVVIGDVDLEVAEQAAKALSSKGEIHALFLDVTDADAFAETVQKIEAEIGSVDVLVNNAGIMPLGAFLDQSPANDAKQIGINLGGVINGMRAALPRMRARGHGHVVNVASMAGKVPVPYAAVYTATKHAVVGMTEAVRAELRDTGVELSYVMPIPVKTELIAGAARMKWPPPVRPETVAKAIVDATRRRRVDVFVPGSQRLIAALPALLPRFVGEGLARVLGLDTLFAEVDEEARRNYVQRTTGA